MILGGVLVAGEMVVLEEDHELSRHGTEPQLQIYLHFSATLSVSFGQFELSKREAFIENHRRSPNPA